MTGSFSNLSALANNGAKTFDIEENRDIIDTQMQITRSSRRQKRCCCSLFPIDDEEFDFFPLSFLFYVLFIIFLSILISIIDITNYYENNESIINLLFGYSMKSYHQNSLFGLHSIKSFHSSNVLDIILIFGILTLSIWESLFSFYRYYAAFSVTKYFTDTSSTVVIKKFIYYAIPFSVVFIIQIYFYYWLFPIVILLHLLFNFFCSWKFASILIMRYKLFIDADKAGAVVQENQNILNIIYYTKNTSLICCILQSIYLSMFVVTYNVNTAYYLPILWSISCIVNTMNFVRNRLFIKRKICKSCLCTKETAPTAPTSHSHSHQIPDQSPISIADTNNNQSPPEKTKKAIESIQNQIDAENNEIAENNPNYPPKIRILTRQSNSAQNVFEPKVKVPKLQSSLSEPVRDDDERADDKETDMDMDKMEFIDDDEPDSDSPPLSSSIPRITITSNKPKKSKSSRIMPQLTQNTSINKSISSLRLKLQTMNSNSNKRYSSIKHTKMTDLEDRIIGKNENVGENETDQKTRKMKIKSGNLDTNPNQMNFDEVVESLSILAKYGFCSKQSINSVKQLQVQHGRRVTIAANVLLNVPNNDQRDVPTMAFSHSAPNNNMRNKNHAFSLS